MAKRYDDRYGRGGHRRDRDRADDRGYVERAGDEVRSWFGDDDAERRRHMDEMRDRERERRYGSDWNRSDRNPTRRDWNQSDDRTTWNRSAAPRRDWDRSDWERSTSGRADWDRERSTSSRQPEDWRHSGTMGYGWAGSSSDWDRWNRDRDRMGSAGYDESWRYRDPGRDRDEWRDRSQEFETRGNYSGRDWSVDEGRTQFGQRIGRGPKGYQRPDARVFEDVCDRLTYSDVDAENIEVRVENGEVTLSGSVRDRWDKRRAEDVVENVSGVRDVHNNIRVHREDRGLGQSDKSASSQPGTVLGVNPTEGSSITNTPPKGSTRS
jgi:osmotically-inducible protein OsmY